MQTVDVPFTWGMMMNAIRAPESLFALNTQVAIASSEHSCVIIFNTVNEMFSVRDWLNVNDEIEYRKFGHIYVPYDHAPRDQMAERCLGFRFVFNEEGDLDYFNLACDNGRRLTHIEGVV